MSLLDRFAPRYALRRELARTQLEALRSRHTGQRYYEAATSDQYRRRNGNNASGNAVMQRAGHSLTNEARWLDENHDLVVGILDELVNNIVGTGIVTRPSVKLTNGELDEKTNRRLRKAWRQWCRRPEVTGQMSWETSQRLACRSWLRDGEVLAQHVEGTKPIQHQTKVPYSVELVECDLLPFDSLFMNTPENTLHGITVNGWGAPVTYHILKQHPGDMLGVFTDYSVATKPVPADKIVHLKFVRRLHQLRGVSILHAILNRLEDIKDYEESERIAARVAAAMTGVITSELGAGGAYSGGTPTADMEMAPGMMFNLQPGEDAKLISADRPNTGLLDFRQSQMRAASAGTGTKYSAVSRDYNGTYSAQRQEMVESRVGYTALREQFISSWVREIYSRFVEWAKLSGVVKPHLDTDLDTLYDAEHAGPGMPWIDPKKEMDAYAIAKSQRFKARHQIITELGGDPEAVDEQIERERAYDKDHGIDQAPAAPTPNNADDDPDTEGADDEDQEDDQAA